MKNCRWLVTCVALALAGIMGFAELGWAQCRGGYGPRGRDYQVDQTGWRGRGQGYANCPNYSGADYGAQGGGYARGARNSSWGGRDNCPNYSVTQTTATPAGQIPR